jgi:CspA family cold shock protein
MKRRGIVKHVNAEKGYGFIIQDQTGDDVFMHITKVRSFTLPPVGTKVAYEIVPGRNGKNAAINR